MMIMMVKIPYGFFTMYLILIYHRLTVDRATKTASRPAAADKTNGPNSRVNPYRYAPAINVTECTNTCIAICK